MRSVLVILAAVLIVPLFTLGVLYARGGKVVVVHNSGASSLEAQVRGESQGYVENTDKRTVHAGSWDWMIFFPRIAGPLALHCVDGGGLSLTQLGPNAPPRFLYASVTLQGCGHVAQRSGWGL
ncbi:MAG: hypothetical protein JO261_15690 [Alphaproteobacteria bacterium]|nr:hypothetical protein [Alphaproteobacteria bacterium]MBV9695136.1 hypothetical protein [Alphaproteobacteria bacterium]